MNNRIRVTFKEPLKSIFEAFLVEKSYGIDNPQQYIVERIQNDMITWQMNKKIDNRIQIDKQFKRTAKKEK